MYSMWRMQILHEIFMHQVDLLVSKLQDTLLLSKDEDLIINSLVTLVTMQCWV